VSISRFDCWHFRCECRNAKPLLPLCATRSSTRPFSDTPSVAVTRFRCVERKKVSLLKDQRNAMSRQTDSQCRTTKLMQRRRLRIRRPPARFARTQISAIGPFGAFSMARISSDIPQAVSKLISIIARSRHMCCEIKILQRSRYVPYFQRRIDKLSVQLTRNIHYEERRVIFWQ